MESTVIFFRCYAGVGRIYNLSYDTATPISLGERCIVPKLIAHEVLHVLGKKLIVFLVRIGKQISVYPYPSMLGDSSALPYHI